MRLLVFLSAIVYLAGCDTMPPQSHHASDQTRYLCYTYDYPAEHVLTLPVPEENTKTASVEVWFQGNSIDAIYAREGLTQLWVFSESLYVKVDPDNNAQYWDFRGAKEGESRKPEAVFECKKRS